MPIKIRLDTRFFIHFIITDLELGYPLVDRLSLFFRGAPGRIRTPDPLIRSQVLYPAELSVRFQKYITLEWYDAIKYIFNRM